MAVRPRQARYQAALRPDINCAIDSKAVSKLLASVSSTRNDESTQMRRRLWYERKFSDLRYPPYIL